MKKNFLLGLFSILFTATCFCQNVGIGNTNPVAGLHIIHNNGIIAKGDTLSSNPYVLAETGGGAKLIWHPKKAAFIVGLLDNSGNNGKLWDEDSIGFGAMNLGYSNVVKGYYSFATGIGNYISGGGFGSVAMGHGSFADSNECVAIGFGAEARGRQAVAIGTGSVAIGRSSFATGYVTTASGYTSTAGGYFSTAKGDYSFSNGYGNYSGAIHSFTVGILDSVYDFSSPYDGARSAAAFGWFNKVRGAFSLTAGSGNVVDSGGYNSLVVGFGNRVSNNEAIALGNSNTARGKSSIAIGIGSIANGNYSVAIGNTNQTASTAISSAALGQNTIASGPISTSMGDRTVASGASSTAMGDSTTANGNFSTSLGKRTIASGNVSTAMGYNTTASGASSTATGDNTTASGNFSTAMGQFASTASHTRSFVINGSSNAAGNNITTSTADYQMMMNFNDYTFTTNTPNTFVQFTDGGRVNIKGTTNFSQFNFGVNEDTYIRPGKNGSSVIINDLAFGKTGVGTASPLSTLHIKMVNTAPDGLLIERDINNKWMTGVDFANDYSIYIFNGSGFVYRGYFDHVSGNYISLSDKNLKKDIEPLDNHNALSLLLKLNPVRYHFVSGERQKFDYGFISQEVEEVFPDFVSEKNGIKMLTYNSFIPVTVKAVQEQQHEIEELKNENAELRARLDRLEKMLLKNEKIAK